MVFTPVTIVLIGFVAGLSLLTGAFLIHRGFARVSGRRWDAN